MNIATLDWVSLEKKKINGITAKDISDGCGKNTGNLVHVNAYEKVLKKHCFTPFSEGDTEFINSQDLLLIKCANQIGNHVNFDHSYLEAIKKVKIPIIMCCLGAQNDNFDNLDILSKDSNCIDLFKLVSSKNTSEYPNISVRGEYSQRVLKFYGIESAITGCINTILFKDKLGLYLRNKYLNKNIKNICVAGGNPHDPKYSWLETQLRIITEKHNGIYIAQGTDNAPFSLIHGEYVEIPDFFEEIYSLNKEEIRRWFIKYGKTFCNTDYWSNVMKLYDMVVGPRYHGVSIGLQNETIGTIFSIDSRTKELAITNGIKHIDGDLLKNKNYNEILEMSLWNNEDYNYLDHQINFCKNQFSLFFNQNNVEFKV